MAEWHAGDSCQVTEHGPGGKPKPGGRVYPGTVTSAVGEFVHVEAESGMMIGTLNLTFHARSGWLAGPAEGQFQWRLLPASGDAGRTCEMDGTREDTNGAEHYWNCSLPGVITVDGKLLCEDHAGELGYGPKQEEYGFDPHDGLNPTPGFFPAEAPRG